MNCDLKTLRWLAVAVSRRHEDRNPPRAPHHERSGVRPPPTPAARAGSIVPRPSPSVRRRPGAETPVSCIPQPRPPEFTKAESHPEWSHTHDAHTAPLFEATLAFLCGFLHFPIIPQADAFSHCRGRGPGGVWGKQLVRKRGTRRVQRAAGPEEATCSRLGF